jgi:hypothetical protein
VDGVAAWLVAGVPGGDDFAVWIEECDAAATCDDGPAGAVTESARLVDREQDPVGVWS